MGDLLVASARIGRPQHMEAFEVALMENDSCRADDSPLEIKVAFVRRKQVAAAVRRDLLGIPQCVANVFIYLDPARCRRTGSATFSALLDVDLAEFFGLTLQAR